MDAQRSLRLSAAVLAGLFATANDASAQPYGSNRYAPSRQDIHRLRGRCDPIRDGCGPYREYNIPFGDGQPTSPPTDSFYFRHADGRD